MNNIQVKFGLAISFPKTTFPLQDSNSKFSCASTVLAFAIPRPLSFFMILLGCPSSKMAAKASDELKFGIFENLFQDNWDEIE